MRLSSARKLAAVAVLAGLASIFAWPRSNLRAASVQHGYTVQVVNDTIAFGQADSNVVPIETGSSWVQGLLLRMNTNTMDTVTVAVQIRCHLNGNVDTASVFPWYPRGTGTATGGDSLRFGSTASPSFAAAGRSEFYVTLVNDAGAAARFGNQASAFINLHDVYGVGFWSPYTSVRIRPVAGSRGECCLTTPTYKAWLLLTRR